MVEFQAKYPKAVESLVAHWERLIGCFDFPAEHWKHLRATNVIEAPFAAGRLRVRATSGAGGKFIPGVQQDQPNLITHATHNQPREAA